MKNFETFLKEKYDIDDYHKLDDIIFDRVYREWQWVNDNQRNFKNK